MRRVRVKILAVLCALSMALLSGCGVSWTEVIREGLSQLQQEELKQREPSGEEPQAGETDKEPSRSPAENGEPEEKWEPAPEISDGNYAYECLDETGKEVYDQMLQTILSYEESVELATTDTEVMGKAYEALCADYGGLFWVQGYTFTSYTMGEKVVGLEFAPDYRMEEQQKDAYQQQVDQVVEVWLAGISPQASDYEKARFVFESLIERVDYVEGAPENQTILSVFLYGETVCQGYASATQYLLQRLGIPAAIISGYANGEAHAWNLIALDGVYYYMDTTWGNSTYLDQDSLQEKFVNHNFMCMTERELLLNHQPETSFPLPECNSIEHNYYVQEGRYFDAWDPEAIGSVFREAWESGQPFVSVKFVNEQLYDQMKDYFVHEQRITDYCAGIDTIYYMEAPEFCVFTVNFD